MVYEPYTHYNRAFLQAEDDVVLLSEGFVEFFLHAVKKSVVNDSLIWDVKRYLGENRSLITLFGEQKKIF